MIGLDCNILVQLAFADHAVVVHFGFLVARSTCRGLPRTTKVPRR